MWASILAIIGPALQLLNKIFDLFKRPTQDAVDDEKKKAEDEAQSLKETGRPK